MCSLNYIIFLILVLVSNGVTQDFTDINDEKQNYTGISSSIEITADVEQEYFPVIAKLLSEGYKHPYVAGLVKWNLQNLLNDSIKIILSCEVPEWIPPVISNVYLAPLETKEIAQTPFGKQLLNNRSTSTASVLLIAKSSGKILFEETRNIKIRPTDDMIWSFHSPWDSKELIAAWVMPKDEAVEEILALAKEKIYNRTLAGYLSQDLLGELKAIFNTVRNAKVSYVNSSMSFGEIGFTQRVRTPQESIHQRSANCIDGAVLFASLFENIGLEPLIILMPSHAIVGVRIAPNSSDAIFIETTLVGRNIMESILTFKTTFDAAVEQGLNVYNEALSRDPSSVYILDIKRLREQGIYPLW